MSKFFKYLKIQFKRAAKVYPVVLAFTAVLAVCALVLLANMITNNATSEDKQNLRIGIVGDLGNSFLNIGIETVQSFDSSRYYVTFETIESEQEAQKLIKSNEYEGYILIPDTFIDSLSTSRPDTITYVSRNTPNAIAPLLVEELVTIVSDFVLESEKGILGAEDIAHEYDVKIDMYDAHMRFINSILARDGVYEVKQTGIGNGIGFTSYYIFAFLILLLLLWGISGCTFLIKKDMAFPGLLRSQGFSCSLQILGDYIPFASMIAINLTVITFALGFLPLDGLNNTVSYAVATPADALLTALMLLPCAILISAMQFFIYELCSNTISAVLAQLLSCVALSYCSGFLYPLNSLPENIQAISKILPTGLAFKYTAATFTADLNLGLIGSVMIYSAVFLLLSVFVRDYKIRRSAA